MRLGSHIGGSIDTCVNFKEIHERLGHQVYQVFCGSPQKFKSSSGEEAVTSLLIKKIRESLAEPILHGSYMTSFVRTDYVGRNTREVAIQLMKLCSDNGAKIGVFHVGSRGKETEYLEALEHLAENVFYILDRIPEEVVFTLETSKGSSTGFDMGRVEVLVELVKFYPELMRRKNFGITFDTQHLFADGVIIKEGTQPYILLETLGRCVHLNANEKGEFGGHLDRHSTISFEESKDLSLEDLIPVLKVAERKNLPMVLERNQIALLEKDYLFVTNKINEWRGKWIT